jgi:hypothetical protein
MSTLRLTTISNQDGSATVPSQTVISGSAKAWVNFNGTGTVAIRTSFNVTSITDNGTGDYTVNFTTAMPDANYVVTCESARDNSSTAAGAWIVAPFCNSATGPLLKTTTQIRIATSTLGGAAQDYLNAGVVIHR